MCVHGSGTPVYEHCSRYGTMNAVRVAQFLFFVLVENVRLTLVIFHFSFKDAVVSCAEAFPFGWLISSMAADNVVSYIC